MDTDWFFILGCKFSHRVLYYRSSTYKSPQMSTFIHGKYRIKIIFTYLQDLWLRNTQKEPNIKNQSVSIFVYFQLGKDQVRRVEVGRFYILCYSCIFSWHNIMWDVYRLGIFYILCYSCIFSWRKNTWISTQSKFSHRVLYFHSIDLQITPNVYINTWKI
jgi:hypothetical protein